MMHTIAGKVPGLPRLFNAGILYGSLSTVSSANYSLAAVSLEDLVKPSLRIGKQ